MSQRYENIATSLNDNITILRVILICMGIAQEQ